MKNPSLELDIESKVLEYTNKLVNNKRKSLLMFCFKKLQLKEIDQNKLSIKLEDVKYFSLKIRTFRYDGELLFREFNTGKSLQMLNKRYELAEKFK